ncbi:MAG TPA: hypothetical protein VEQ15_10010 [Myxococcales bacterium]|jgi:hypothetical protein|nr:hypothetical protein [Myxococcales bacterium]
MRFVLAGVSDRFASQVRSRRREMERVGSAAEVMRMLHRASAPRLLVVSEMLPGAGDVLAAVEADSRLARLVFVVVLGDRTALAVALRNQGVTVLPTRGAGSRLRRLLRESAALLQQARECLLRRSRSCAAASERHVRTSRRLIEQSRRLCARCGSMRTSPKRRRLPARQPDGEP